MAVHRYARDDLFSGRLIGNDDLCGVAFLITFFIGGSALVFAQVLHRIKADVDLVDVLNIDVSQAFDVADILDDLFRDDRVGIDLRLQLDLRSKESAAGGKLQLASDQFAFCSRFALGGGFLFDRRKPFVFDAFVMGGVDLLHAVAFILRC